MQESQIGTSWRSLVTEMSKALLITTRIHPLLSFAVAVRSCQTALSTESASSGTTGHEKNSVVVAQEKNANFLESVFGINCTVHCNVNIVFNNANPATSGL